MLRLHEQGDEEAVAAVRTNLTPGHLAILSPELGADPGSLSAERDRLGVDEIGVVVVQPTAAGSEPLGLQAEVSVEADRRGERRGVVPDVVKPASRGARALQALTALVIGALIPVLWVSIADPGVDTGDEALAVSLAGIAASYLILAIAAGLVSGRVRARSRTRRMREAWERSLTEWQPPGWTYHAIEEVLIAAALISVIALVVLMLTVGGFA